MKIKDLKEAIQEYPDDATLELGTILGADVENEEAYTIVLDHPIIGLGFNPEDNHVRLVIATKGEEDVWVKKLGKIERMKTDDAQEEKPDSH